MAGGSTGALHEASARAIAHAVRYREVSVEGVTAHHLDRIGARPELKAFITVDAERALERARTIDRGPAPTGLLAGVPFAPKDCWDTAGLRTTFGSSIFRERVPERTAPAVQRIVDAGAVILGKANLNEFARGVTTANATFGQCLNPARPGYTPAGSSGAATRRRSRPASSRSVSPPTPAAPSARRRPRAASAATSRPFGRVSVEGAFGLAEPFDHAGPMARSIDDVILAMEVLVGRPPPTPRLRGLRVGLTPAATSAIERGLLAEGAAVDQVAIPDFAHLIAFHLAEFAYTHRDLYPAHASEYSPEARAMLERGRAVTAVEYRAAAVALAEWRRTCEETLACDLVVGPTLDGEPPRLGEAEDHALLLRISGFTRPFNLLAGPPRPRGTARSSPVATRRSCSARRLPGTGAWPTDRRRSIGPYRSTD